MVCVLASFVYCSLWLSMNGWGSWQPLAAEGWSLRKEDPLFSEGVCLNRHKSLRVWGDNLLLRAGQRRQK